MVNTGSLLLLVCQGVTSTIIRIGEDLGTGGCSDILNSLEVISIISIIFIEFIALDILWDIFFSKCNKTRLGLLCQTPVQVKPLPLSVSKSSSTEALFSPSKDHFH